MLSILASRCIEALQPVVNPFATSDIVRNLVNIIECSRIGWGTEVWSQSLRQAMQWACEVDFSSVDSISVLGVPADWDELNL